MEPATQTADERATSPDERGQDAWSVAWRQFRRNRSALFGLGLIALLFGVAAFAPLLANGRPLHVRGYLTDLYETDLAAFLDWHERLVATTRGLRQAATRREREELGPRRALYVAGLPAVLDRLASRLDPARERELRQLAAEYGALLQAPPAEADLEALERLGARIERDYGRLSLVAAYKRAARPLLHLPELLDDPAAAGDRLPAARAALAAGVEALLGFLRPEDRPPLADGAGRLLAGLERLDPGAPDPAAVTALQDEVEALAGLLDRLADYPVAPAQEQLPLSSQWPALEALTPGDVLVMALYLTVLAAVALRAVFLRLGNGARLAALLGPALLAALAWSALVPERQLPAESLYKAFAQRLAEHPDGASAVVFAPVPFGENENIYADRMVPPTAVELWKDDSTLRRRLRQQGEVELEAAEARARLDRLRAHWLGTDDNGRDVLARLILGSRVSLSVGFVAVGIYVLIGVVLGALAGYFSGWLDMGISRFTEVVMCFPSFFLIITVMATFQRPSIWLIMAVIGLTHWTGVMRLVRGEFLRLTSQDFVTAGRALGYGPVRIIFRHVLPNALGPVFVAATFGVAGAILIESALSFLGFGVPQPTASWGSVLHEAFQKEQQMWWVTVFAGLLIFVTITAYNLVGEGLRDALDPKLRQ